jgi:hypothetical protein
MTVRCIQDVMAGQLSGHAGLIAYWRKERKTQLLYFTGSLDSVS